MKRKQKQETKREEAEERAKSRAKRSAEQQLAKLDREGHRAVRERTRLQNKIKRTKDEIS